MKNLLVFILQNRVFIFPIVLFQAQYQTAQTTSVQQTTVYVQIQTWVEVLCPLLGVVFPREEFVTISQIVPLKTMKIMVSAFL